MVLALAERFGQPPHDVLNWDAEILRMLEIEARGRPEDPDGHGQ